MGYYKEETKNEAGFVEKLAKPFDLFVNDAFGTAHRAHASTEGVTKFLSPSVSGFLLAKELGVGISLVEDDFVDTAKKVMKKAEKLGKTILLPSDIVIADKFAADANTKVVPVGEIPDGWMGLDNGPDTTAEQKDFLSTAKTVIMNGPMGVFEME